MSTSRVSADQPRAASTPADEQRLLRRALRIDGWSTAVFGVVLLATSAVMAGPLGFPTSWSIPFGVAMLGGGACVVLVAGYPVVTRRAAAIIVSVNLLSGIGLALMTVSCWIPLTPAGVVFLLFGAALVVVFAVVELVCLRQSVPSAPAIPASGGAR